MTRSEYDEKYRKLSRCFDIPTSVKCAEDYKSCDIGKLQDKDESEELARCIARVNYYARCIHNAIVDANFQCIPTLISKIRLCELWASQQSYPNFTLSYKDPSKSRSCIMVDNVFKLYVMYIKLTLATAVEGMRCNFSKPYTGYKPGLDESPFVFIVPYKEEHFHPDSLSTFMFHPLDPAFDDRGSNRCRSGDVSYFEAMYFKDRDKYALGYGEYMLSDKKDESEIARDSEAEYNHAHPGFLNLTPPKVIDMINRQAI